MGTEKIQKCIIGIDGWQMQCCGVPFKIGDTVEWLVCEPERSENYTLFRYEHHSAEWQTLSMITGTVDKIEALFYCDELDNEGSIHTHDVLEADGWDEDIGDLQFGSYRVSLHGCVIRPARENEVTFLD